MKPTLKSIVKLRSLTIKQDKKNYIVEDREAKEYYEMPRICIDALEQMEQGRSLEEIQSQLEKDYSEEDVDLLDFIAQLMELDLIAELDGQMVERSQTMKQQAAHTSWIPMKVARFFFNRISTKLYALLAVFNLLVFITQPHLFPHFIDMLVFDSMVLNTIMWLSLSFVLLINHETGHLMAVRAQGLPARLGIGHRLFFVVFETEMTQVWSLPSRARNVPFLGGMCFDQVLLFIALLIQGVFPHAAPLLLAIMGVIVFKLMMMLAYQFMFFMKTDIYYIVENITGCYNLLENSTAWLRQKLPILKKRLRQVEIFAGEERVVKAFSGFYMLGFLLSMLLLFTYFLPLLLQAFALMLPNLKQPVNDPYFWDAIAFLCEVALMLGLLLFSWIRKLRERIISLSQ